MKQKKVLEVPTQLTSMECGQKLRNPRPPPKKKLKKPVSGRCLSHVKYVKCINIPSTIPVCGNTSVTTKIYKFPQNEFRLFFSIS
jgi:hypothetical protein